MTVPIEEYGEVVVLLLSCQKEKKQKHKRTYPINGIDYYYDGFPTDIILNYPANNFQIHVNDRDYCMSKLSQLNIKSDYNAEWISKNPYFQSIVAT